MLKNISSGTTTLIDGINIVRSLVLRVRQTCFSNKGEYNWLCAPSIVVDLDPDRYKRLQKKLGNSWKKRNTRAGENEVNIVTRIPYKNGNEAKTIMLIKSGITMEGENEITLIVDEKSHYLYGCFDETTRYSLVFARDDDGKSIANKLEKEHGRDSVNCLFYKGGNYGNYGKSPNENTYSIYNAIDLCLSSRSWNSIVLETNEKNQDEICRQLDMFIAVIFESARNKLLEQIIFSRCIIAIQENSYDGNNINLDAIIQIGKEWNNGGPVTSEVLAQKLLREYGRLGLDSAMKSSGKYDSENTKGAIEDFKNIANSIFIEYGQYDELIGGKEVELSEIEVENELISSDGNRMRDNFMKYSKLLAENKSSNKKIDDDQAVCNML